MQHHNSSTIKNTKQVSTAFYIISTYQTATKEFIDYLQLECNLSRLQNGSNICLVVRLWQWNAVTSMDLHLSWLLDQSVNLLVRYGLNCGRNRFFMSSFCRLSLIFIRIAKHARYEHRRRFSKTRINLLKKYIKLYTVKHWSLISS